jgi:hypothetical protein
MPRKKKVEINVQEEENNKLRATLAAVEAQISSYVSSSPQEETLKKTLENIQTTLEGSFTLPAESEPAKEELDVSRDRSDMITQALKELQIFPDKQGLVTSNEAAKLLTWRAWHEFGIHHMYKPVILRSYVMRKELKAYATKYREGRYGAPVPVVAMYRVVDMFTLSIKPHIGYKRALLMQGTAPEVITRLDYIRKMVNTPGADLRGLPDLLEEVKEHITANLSADSK